MSDASKRHPWSPIGGCAVILIAGCASSGPVPIGSDAFMITKQSSGGGFGSPAAVKADLYAEAAAFCAGKGRDLKTIEAKETPGIPMVRIASAELQFQCVPKP